MSPQDTEHRLLLVSANEDVREAVEAALITWREPHRLYWVTQPELAASRVIELMPRIILVDDGLGASPERYTRQLSDVCPMGMVVALVGGERVDMASRMVLGGARAVVQKPIQSTELLQTLSALTSGRAGQAPMSQDELNFGHMVTLVGSRGGVGRTTIAVNLAINLHRETGQSVALVDGDFLSPGVDVMLNVLGNRTMSELLDRSAAIDPDLVSGVMNHHASGIDVLLAPGHGEANGNAGTARIERLAMILKHLYAWTVIDLGQPFGEAANAFSDGSDVVLLVLPPEMVSVRNARPILEQMRGRGYAKAKIWGVLNRSTVRHSIPVADIESRLVEIRHAIPDEPALALASINRGVPVSIRHKRSALARSYRGLAIKLVKAFPSTDESASDAKPAKRTPRSARGAKPAKE